MTHLCGATDRLRLCWDIFLQVDVVIRAGEEAQPRGGCTRPWGLAEAGPGSEPMGRPGLEGLWQGRAVGSWRPVLLWCFWAEADAPRA